MDTKQLRKKLKKVKRTIDRKTEKELLDLQEEDLGFQADIPKEVDGNKNTFYEKKGTPILYNNEVQLIHAKTQLFVAVSKKLNLSEKAQSQEEKESETSAMSNSKE